MARSVSLLFQSPAEASSYRDVTVIVPTRNEAEVIITLLQILDKTYPELRVLVADDQSIDGTQELVRKFSSDSSTIQLLERRGARVRGLTTSVLEAIGHCQSTYFVVMDADLQHPPEKIGEIVEKLRHGADLVIACRLTFPPTWLLWRKFVSLLGTTLAKTYLRFYKTEVDDPLSGFFGGRTEVFQGLIEENSTRFEHRGYKVLLDSLKIASGTLHLEAVWYSFSPRLRGHSKFRLRHGLLFVRSLFR